MRIAAALAIAGLTLNGCARKSDSSAVSGKLSGQNLLLITLDTTRADRLGCYGYKPAVTPALDALAARGVLFENAIAQAPLTLPSHCSIMTGRYPREHGVRDNGANALGLSHPTLASIFKEHGYKTAAFVASFVLDSRFGLERGFDTYSDDMGETGYKIQPLEWQQPANAITDRAIAWLEAEKNSKNPFFCWVHYYDPHQPYVPPQRVMKPELEPYDGELAFVDTEVKRLLDWFEAAKLTDHTLVVVVGDHGEAFGEHGEKGHSNFVYDVNLHVPMIVAHPAVVPGPKRVAAIVEALEVFPTVLDLFGFKPPEGIMSRSLGVALAGGKLQDAAAYAESHFVFNSFGWAEQRALTTARWKYVSSTWPQLFDRMADPGEQENVIATQPKAAAKMLSELKSRYESMTAGKAAVVELDQRARDAIRGLGYLGGTTRTTDEFLTEGLPDPKAHLNLITKLELAHDIMEQAENPKEYAFAIPLLRSVVDDSPNSYLFQFMLGTCLYEVDELEDAVKAFQSAIKINPENAEVYRALAMTLARMERTGEAIQHFDVSLKLDDRNPDVHFQYAEVLQRLGRSEEAIRHYEKAVELFPNFAVAYARLSHSLKQKGRTDEAKRNLELAIDQFRIALDRSPQDADLHFRLGMAYVQSERTSEAVTEFREALRLKPKHGDALFNLGLSLEMQGEVQEAEEILRRATAHSEVAADAYHALGVMMNKQGKIEEAVKLYEQCVALKPSKSLAVEDLTGYYLGNRRFSDAIRILQLAVEKSPNNVMVLNTLAKLLATCRDSNLRNGKAAVALALKAAELTHNQEPSVLATLAAAYAETGDFTQAAEIARKAAQRAEDTQEAELALMIRDQLDGYLKNQPYRDPRT